MQSVRKSLYKKADNDEIIARIDRLRPSSQAKWGKMDVSQMLAHLQVLFKITYGELLLNRGLAGFLFGKIAKKKLLSGQPVKKNLPTFKQAKIEDSREFSIEKGLLINYISRMAAAGPEAITQRPHPFFGPLTAGEWDTLHYTHLDHHLKQFGV